ncbi:MAG: hypothetical protein CBB87_06180 [Micavibrio sp. TMED27]|nr:hypothetical protein [Micavibrio sp.]OUT91598.1 MAG: hypothetical protein CBB87_06180 [Micavibrio sp. TMED27]
MKTLSKLALLATTAAVTFANPVHAGDVTGTDLLAKERFQIRARAIGVIPDDGGHTTIGGKPDADNAFVPEVDVTYFMTNNWALELIAATSPHDLKLKNSVLGDLDLGDTWILPPTLTLQYHLDREAKFSPYVGAGINYTLPYSEDAAGGVVTSLDADGSFGFALQAGADYWLNDNWGLNFDVKKVWLDVDATVNNTITGEVELDPWIVGVGVSYRF